MPETIGAAIFYALGASATGATVIGAGITVNAVVGSAVLLAGSVALQAAMAPTVPAAGVPKGSDGHQPLRQPIPPRTAGFGRTRLAGAYVLFEERDHTSYDVMAICQGPIAGIAGYYLHGDGVTIDPDTGIVDACEIVDGRYTPEVPEGESEEAVFITIDTRLGLPTETHYPAIAAALPDLWTPQHRGDGIASAMMVCLHVIQPLDFSQKYPRGLPSLSVIADMLAWDPRDTDQDPDDPSTWVVTSNPVAHLCTYLISPNIGMGLPRAEIIDPVIDHLKAQATLCDQQVELAEGGTEAMYASNGWYTLETEPAEVINQILATCDGWLADNGSGAIALHIGVYTEPTVIFEVGDILGFSVSFGTADEEAVNQLDIRYTSPQLKYSEVAGDPWRDEADISARGKVRARPLSLPWVHSHNQARRIASRVMQRANATLRGSIVTTAYGLAGLGERYVRIRYPFIAGLENAVVEVQRAGRDIAGGTVSFDWVLVRSDTLDAFTPDDEGIPAPVPVTEFVLREDETLLLREDGTTFEREEA